VEQRGKLSEFFSFFFKSELIVECKTQSFLAVIASKNCQVRYGAHQCWAFRIRVGHFLYESGTFYQQAKKVRKILISTTLQLFFYFLSLKTDVNVPSKKYLISKKSLKKLLFFVGILSATDKKSSIRIRIRKMYGSTTLLLGLTFLTVCRRMRSCCIWLN
jgi:hypothetical protein